MQKRKITKRQMKKARGPNEMMLRSLKQGELIEMSDRSYRGNPEARWTGMIHRYMVPAVPFVRVD